MTDTPELVTAEMVEAGARVRHQQQVELFVSIASRAKLKESPKTWDELTEEGKNAYRTEAEEFLRATYPLIAKAVQERCAQVADYADDWRDGEPGKMGPRVKHQIANAIRSLNFGTPDVNQPAQAGA